MISCARWWKMGQIFTHEIHSKWKIRKNLCTGGVTIRSWRGVPIRPWSGVPIRSYAPRSAGGSGVPIRSYSQFSPILPPSPQFSADLFLQRRNFQQVWKKFKTRKFGKNDEKLWKIWKKNVIFGFFGNFPPLVYRKWCAYNPQMSICRGL